MLPEIFSQFAIEGEFEKAEPFGSGHINDSYRSQWNRDGAHVRYLHQRINERVFAHPDEVMENIVRVTGHIAEKLAREGGDLNRRVLRVVPTRDGKSWTRDAEGGWWRTYFFIEGSHSLDLASSPDEARFLGRAVGRFQKLLADLPPPPLHETIPRFHNMEWRYQQFYEALSRTGRADEAREEIAFMRENEERGSALIRALREGKIPERLSHNDTKMNNILIDNETGEALCVVDLDTVMPGTCLFDVGDLIRSVTTRAEEDERDLSRVCFDPGYFKALLEGYHGEAKDFLTPEEKKLFTEAGRNITQIMALRFLIDFLEGDHYYPIKRPGHNLDRCRNQIALIRSMDSQWKTAEDIAGKIGSRE